jgi:hypothetical protein
MKYMNTGTGTLHVSIFRSFKSKQSLEYIEAQLRDFNKEFQARADLAVAAVVVGGTGNSALINY